MTTTKTDQEVLQERDDAQMMEREHLWPHNWVLPVKKYFSEMERPMMGFLLKGEGPTVFIGLGLAVNPLEVIEKYDAGKWPVEEFATYSDAASAGWLVD